MNACVRKRESYPRDNNSPACEVVPTLSQRVKTAKRPVGFTLIELLVVIAIISLLVSILLPSLSKAMELAKGAKCLANLRNIGVTMAFYTQDNDGVLPSSIKPMGTWNQGWWFYICDYLDDDPAVMECPIQHYSLALWDPKLTKWSYGYNRGLQYRKVDELMKNPVLIADGVWQFASLQESVKMGYPVSLHWNYLDGEIVGAGLNRAHNDGPNMLHVAGNVSNERFEDLTDEYFISE